MILIFVHVKYRTSTSYLDTSLILLVHTYNTQEASRKAINAAFSREVDSLVSL